MDAKRLFRSTNPGSIGSIRTDLALIIEKYSVAFSPAVIVAGFTSTYAISPGLSREGLGPGDGTVSIGVGVGEPTGLGLIDIVGLALVRGLGDGT